VKAFRFRFETLLKVRKIREDLAQQEFSRIQRHLNDLGKLKETRSSQWSLTGRRLAEQMKRGIRPHELDAYRSYLSHLEAEIGRIEELMAQAARRLEEKREELIAAKRELKVMERLRDIDLQRYIAEESREDARFMDELAIQRHGSRQ
jgi:flagellar FliJ protein